MDESLSIWTQGTYRQLPRAADYTFWLVPQLKIGLSSSWPMERLLLHTSALGKPKQTDNNAAKIQQPTYCNGMTRFSAFKIYVKL